MSVHHLLLQITTHGASCFVFAWIEQAEPRVAAAAGGRGKEGGGGVKVGATWQSSSEITQTPRQGSA